MPASVGRIPGRAKKLRLSFAGTCHVHMNAATRAWRAGTTLDSQVPKRYTCLSFVREFL